MVRLRDDEKKLEDMFNRLETQYRRVTDGHLATA